MGRYLMTAGKTYDWAESGDIPVNMFTFDLSSNMINVIKLGIIGGGLENTSRKRDSIIDGQRQGLKNSSIWRDDLSSLTSRH